MSRARRGRGDAPGRMDDINHLFAKIGVRDRAQAVTYAFRHGVT